LLGTRLVHFPNAGLRLEEVADTFALYLTEGLNDSSFPWVLIHLSRISDKRIRCLSDRLSRSLLLEVKGQGRNEEGDLYNKWEYGKPKDKKKNETVARGI
jgi:hypothetical protein